MEPMTGIEKITQRIAGDAQQEAEAILAQAQTQADEITARYQAQAEQTAADTLEKGRANAQARCSRLKSAAEMERRQQTLAVKQEVLDKAFALALDKLCGLPEGEYVELLAKLTVKASTTGKEQLILSKQDRARYGFKVATRANELLTQAGKTAQLTLSQDSREFRGGLLLADGDVEVNCTFETLVRLARGSVSGEVAKVLFG